jgi:hypothetical protein
MLKVAASWVHMPSSIRLAQGLDMAESTSKILVKFYQNTRRISPEDSYFRPAAIRTGNLTCITRYWSNWILVHTDSKGLQYSGDIWWQCATTASAAAFPIPILSNKLISSYDFNQKRLILQEIHRLCDMKLFEIFFAIIRVEIYRISSREQPTRSGPPDLVAERRSCNVPSKLYILRNSYKEVDLDGFLGTT